MKTVLRDVRFGLRLLRRTPTFTTVAVVTLAVGIAATTAIFSVVYGLFFAPLPYDEPDRLVMVWLYDRGDRLNMSPRLYADLKAQATVFADINAWGGRRVNLATRDRPENVSAGLATPGFLAMLGYGHPLAFGRAFHEDEGIPGRDRVVVLTYQLWRDRFAGDPAIVGRPVLIDDTPHTVVGVLARGPADHQQVKIWMPLAVTGAPGQDSGSLLVMARLKAGVSVMQADASMTALGGRLERERSPGRIGRTVRVEPFRNNFVRDSTRRGIWLLFGTVLFVLLTACANVANLLLVRGTARHRELAIRIAVGATPASVVRQLLVESVVLALAGGLAGALLAWFIVDAIVTLMPPFTLPSETAIALSVPVLLFAFAVCAIAGVAAGIAPAWHASRTSAGDAMKEGGRTLGDRRIGLRRALVVVQVALALTLLAGGGMASHALLRLVSADLGFRAEDLTTFSLPIPRGRLVSAAQAEAFYAVLSERIRAVPGVTAASISTGMPILGTRFGRPFEIADQRTADPSARPWTRVNMVTPSYHATFGIPIRRGRPLADTDRPGGKPVAIINEALASRFFAGRDPLGQRLLLPPIAIDPNAPNPQPIEWEIVGVQGDAANGGPGRPAVSEVILPFAQSPWPTATVAIRTEPGRPAPMPAIAEVVRTIDATLPIADIRTIDQTLRESIGADRFYTVFLAAFAGVALLLAAIGIYGVMSFSVTQRTHEIGLRMALGGERRQVVGLVLREGLTTAGAGMTLGAIGAVAIGRALQGTIYGVQPWNPVTFAGVAIALLAAVFLACLVPARRAASVDPMVALRQD